MGRKRNDLAGTKYGQWEVLYYSAEECKPGFTAYVCQCSCGRRRTKAYHTIVCERDSGRDCKCRACHLTELGMHYGEMVESMGKVKDGDIAISLGLCVASVARKRRQLGKEPFCRGRPKLEKGKA